MKGEKAKLGIVISVEINRSFGDCYFHVHGHPAKLEGSDVKYVSSSYAPVNGFEMLEGISTYCQGDGGRRERGAYAFTVHYQRPFGIKLDEAVKMARTLTKIDKALRKLEDNRGYAKSYGEYVGRVAEVLKADRILFRVEADKDQRFKTPEYRRLDLGDGIAEINAIVDRWRQGDDEPMYAKRDRAEAV